MRGRCWSRPRSSFDPSAADRPLPFNCRHPPALFRWGAHPLAQLGLALFVRLGRWARGVLGLDPRAEPPSVPRPRPPAQPAWPILLQRPPLASGASLRAVCLVPLLDDLGELP